MAIYYDKASQDRILAQIAKEQSRPGFSAQLVPVTGKKPSKKRKRHVLEDAMAIRMGEMKPEQDEKAAQIAKITPYDELSEQLETERKRTRRPKGMKGTTYKFKPVSQL